MSERHRSRRERRTEAIRQRRRSRAEIRRERERRRWVLRIAAGGGTVLALVIVVYFVVTGLQERAARQPPGDVTTFENLERGHTSEPVNYEQVPPVGGVHAPVWQNCGFYDAPILEENGVHSLEHGAAWITYRPDLAEDHVQALRDLSEGQTFVLVSPYPELPAPIVASAWGNQRTFDAADDPDLRQFVSAFQVGPDTPEPGAPCTGGTSATL